MSTSTPVPAAGTQVLVVDDGRLNRECLSAQLEANGVRTRSAWDLPSLFSAADDGAPQVILLNIETDDSGTLLQVSLDIDDHQVIDLELMRRGLRKRGVFGLIGSL